MTTDTIKISEMLSIDEHYTPDLETSPTEYDRSSGVVSRAYPVFSSDVYIFGNGTRNDADSLDEFAALPVLEIRDTVIHNVGIKPASTNKKTSVVGVSNRHLSSRRRVQLTHFENIKKIRLQIGDGFSDAYFLADNGFAVDQSILDSKVDSDIAWFDFGAVTIGQIESIAAQGQAYINRRPLISWGERQRFGVSLVAPLKLHGDFPSYTILLNAGFGAFLSSARDSDDINEVNPIENDTAAAYGLCVNVRNGTFCIDWNFINQAAMHNNEHGRSGSYDTGISMGSSDFNSGEISIVFDLDIKSGLKITLAAPVGTITTFNFPLLDPNNGDSGMSWDDLFGEANGVAQLPHNTDGVGALNDDYYKVCCILNEFINDQSSDYATLVCWGISRQKYPVNTDDIVIASQNELVGGDWDWGMYDTQLFPHAIELKSMYFESENSVNADGYKAFGSSFNLAQLGREPLRTLDNFVDAGGNDQYQPVV